MAGERSHPCLPCRDLDESIAFYQAIGFACTYLQLRPNPYAVVAREDWHIHLFGMPNFNPADSYGTVIVEVPDPDALFAAISQGLKAAYGKVPAAGIPRLLRPRKKYGTVRGFSVVDPGGNWLRVYKAGSSADEADDEAGGSLAHMIDVAARLGDARGDEALALKTLDNGIARYADAPADERVRAQLYRAELLWRLGQQAAARAALSAARAIPLDADAQLSLQGELLAIEEMLRE